MSSGRLSRGGGDDRLTGGSRGGGDNCMTGRPTQQGRLCSGGGTLQRKCYMIKQCNLIDIFRFITINRPKIISPNFRAN